MTYTEEGQWRPPADELAWHSPMSEAEMVAAQRGWNFQVYPLFESPQSKDEQSVRSLRYKAGEIKQSTGLDIHFAQWEDKTFWVEIEMPGVWGGYGHTQLRDEEAVFHYLRAWEMGVQIGRGLPVAPPQDGQLVDELNALTHTLWAAAGAFVQSLSPEQEDRRVRERDDPSKESAFRADLSSEQSELLSKWDQALEQLRENAIERRHREIAAWKLAGTHHD